MTFTLSVEAMLRQLYARGAMAWAGRRDRLPDLLRPAHEPALRELLRGSFARLALDLMPLVKSTNLDESDPATDPFLIIEIDLPATIDASVLRAAMEQATALRALTGALTGVAPDEAAEVAREASSAAAMVASVAALRGATRPQILPSWA